MSAEQYKKVEEFDHYISSLKHWVMCAIEETGEERFNDIVYMNTTLDALKGMFRKEVYGQREAEKK